MKHTCYAGVTLALIGHVTAWGAVGHQAVGYIAMEFLSSDAAAFVQQTIPAKYQHSLGPAAVWADEVRGISGFRWSEPFHFIDANDDPLGGSCSVDDARDCGSDGCLLTAIANYSQRVTDMTLDATQHTQALYFIDHFLGDIGQPLHVEAYKRGANEVSAICNHKGENLHAIWDTGMIVTQLDADFNSDPQTWASSLVNEIKTGSYKSRAAGWIRCSSITETVSHRNIEDDMKDILVAQQTNFQVTSLQLACPMVWATESNAYDCSNVFDFNTGTDLCTGTYYETNIQVINEQIAKQGYRLAAWLNAIIATTDL